MSLEKDDIAKLADIKPEEFDKIKDWANFQLALRTANKKESFLKEMAGLATTLTAIIGVATAAFTAVQLWNKIRQDDQEQLIRYQFEALKLYTEHWNEFNDKQNCPRFIVFASTIKNKYEELADSVNKDFDRVCRSQIGNPQATANIDIDRAAPDTAYFTIEQVTPTVRAQAQSTQDLTAQTIFVHYKKDNADAKQLAESVRHYVAGNDIGSKAPGIEGIASVPARNEIRIYKSAQMDLAEQLKTSLNTKFNRTFSIVNLEKSYPKLPANTMEIWLSE